MDFGLSIFCTDETPGPAELGRMVEQRGFESLFLPEHTHIPAERQTPYFTGEELPREYARLLDPFVALTAAAAATDHLLLGIGICLIAQHDPIVAAKAAASVDLISGGRFIFGVGAGWNREEMRNHGTEPRERFDIMRERVEAMRAIWTQDEATYAGEHVQFERIWSWPKPVQRPGPPVLVGGNGPTVLDRVLAYGDGWIPGSEPDDDAFVARIADLRRRAADAGREVSVTVCPASSQPARLARLRDAGVDRAVFSLPSAGRGPIETRLEHIEASLAVLRGS